MVQSDRSNSIWHNDIITGIADWLFLYQKQWACCTTFKYLASVCFSSCNMLQKPSIFPSSTCIDQLWGDSCMLYIGVISYVISAAVAFLTRSQQHVVNVLAVVSWYYSSSSKTKHINIVMYITIPNPQRVVMIEMILDGTYQHSSVDRKIINETRIKRTASFDIFTIYKVHIPTTKYSGGHKRFLLAT